MIRTLFAFFTLVFLVGCASKPEPTAAEKDIAALQGAWKISAIDESAFRLTMFEYDKASKMNLVFSGNHFSMAIGDRPAATGNYTLAAEKAPREITLTNNDTKQPALQFIYKIENGTLFLCRTEPGKPLPIAFKSDRETRALALTFSKTSTPAAAPAGQ